MEFLLVFVLVGLVASIPVQDHVPGFDENFPEEVPGLFEGDIELGPGDNPLHRNGIPGSRHHWPNGELPYEIQSSYTSDVKQIFMDAMNEIHEKTKVNGKACITFKPRHGETAYIRFSKGTGCHTRVGYYTSPTAVTIGRGCERKGTVMHELLHALGMYHEQSRDDRDKYIEVHLERVQHGHESNFRKIELPNIDEYNMPYDYGSIMHYGAYSFAKDRSQATIVPKQAGVIIGQRVRLSDIDIKEIQIAYGCIQGSHGAGSSGAVTAAPPTLPPNKGGDTTTFEHGLGTWTQSHSDQTDWRIYAGKTPSSNTGPLTDHGGSLTAKYLYVEASGHTNQVAKLDSKAYPGGDYCFSFYYQMHGSHVGSLALNVLFGTHSTSKHTMHTWQGEHGEGWRHTNLNLHIHTSHTFKFEFEARTGSDYHSDIAIDDIQIHPGDC